MVSGRRGLPNYPIRTHLRTGIAGFLPQVYGAYTCSTCEVAIVEGITNYNFPFMKPYATTLATCLVLLSSVLLVPDVYAQFSAGGGSGGGMGGGGRHGSGERPKDCGSSVKPEGDKGPTGPQGPVSREQLEYHLGTLQVDLHLTPEQTSAWQTFSDRLLALQADMERQRSRNASAIANSASSAGGIKPIASAVDAARNRLTALEDIESTARALYQTLQPDQKTLADLRMAVFVTPLLKI